MAVLAENPEAFAIAGKAAEIDLVTGQAEVDYMAKVGGWDIPCKPCAAVQSDFYCSLSPVL